MDDGFDRDEIRDDMKQANDGAHGRQVGGGPRDSDMGAGGGSSGSGGYGNDQNAQNQQRQPQELSGGGGDPHQSRGERFDELAGGGRGAESVSFDKDRDGGDDLEEDQRAHQDRGQSAAEDES